MNLFPTVPPPQVLAYSWLLPLLLHRDQNHTLEKYVEKNPIYGFLTSCPTELLCFLGRNNSQKKLSFLLGFNVSQDEALVDA